MAFLTGGQYQRVVLQPLFCFLIFTSRDEACCKSGSSFLRRKRTVVRKKYEHFWTGEMFSPLWILCMLSAFATAICILTLLPQKSTVITDVSERLKIYLLPCKSKWSVRWGGSPRVPAARDLCGGPCDVPGSLPAVLSRVCLLPCTLPWQLSASSCSPYCAHSLQGNWGKEQCFWPCTCTVFVHQSAPQNSDLWAWFPGAVKPRALKRW